MYKRQTEYQVTNPLVGVNREYQKAGKTDVISVPTVSHQWEQNLGSAELNYAQGNGSWDDVLALMHRDKKARGNKLRFVILGSLGHPIHLEDPPADAVEEAFRRIQR